MPDSSRSFQPRSGSRRRRLWASLLWWLVAALAAFVLLELVPAHAVPAEGRAWTSPGLTTAEPNVTPPMGMMPPIAEGAQNR